jgi:hypothetical protein
LASGQIGPSLATGAVNATGTSAGLSSAVGFGVEHPDAANARRLTDTPRKIDFIETLLDK